MKKIAAIILTLAMSCANSFAAQEAGNHVYVVRGNVLVAQGKNPAHGVISSETIVANTVIATGEESAALLRFEDGEVVAVRANSVLRIREYHYDPNNIKNSNIVFSIYKGGFRFVTGLIGQQRKPAVRLLTPNGTITIRESDFMVAIVGKSMYSQVLSGGIVMMNDAGVIVLGGGQSAVVSSARGSGSLVIPSAIPSGTFGELLFLPLDPSAIAVPAPVPPPVPAPVPAPAPAPAPAPKSVRTAEKESVGMESRSGRSVTGKIGTLGFGAELSFTVSDRLSARVGLNDGKYNHSVNLDGLNYAFDWQLQTVTAFADWYPFGGSFRASGGILYNNNTNSYIVNPTNGQYNINGTYYSSSTDIASYKGTMRFNKVAPYIGIGWGNPAQTNKGWGLASDIGVFYQGKPASDLVVTCVAVCLPQLQTDASAENSKLENESSFKWWPVINVGIFYHW